MFESLRSALLLPPLAKFAIGMGLIFAIPRVARHMKVPAVVLMLITGIAVGPHVLGLFGEKRPIADFFADLGKLLLMFFTGLEIDLAHLRQAEGRSLIFGLLTTAIPLLLGTAVGLEFGYSLLAAIVVGSLVASHTLLGASIVTKLGANRLEPVVVTVGATVLSDTLSLLVFGLCISTFERGFLLSRFALQLAEIAVFVPLILFGLSRVGARVLEQVEAEEDAYFVLMFGIMAIAAVFAQIVKLPGIVGAFLAGLAVNESVHDKPAKDKLEFFGNSFFIPIFYLVTGFLVDPAVFARSIADNFALVTQIIAALVAGKFVAAEIAGRCFGYSRPARMTIWSLTLPQVAATLTATLVAFSTVDTAHHRLIDRKMLDVVFVLVLTTAVLGPLLTLHFAPRMIEDLPSAPGRDAQSRNPNLGQDASELDAARKRVT